MVTVYIRTTTKTSAETENRENVYIRLMNLIIADQFIFTYTLCGIGY